MPGVAAKLARRCIPIQQGVAVLVFLQVEDLRTGHRLCFRAESPKVARLELCCCSSKKGDAPQGHNESFHLESFRARDLTASKTRAYDSRRAALDELDRVWVLFRVAN